MFYTLNDCHSKVDILFVVLSHLQVLASYGPKLAIMVYAMLYFNRGEATQ